MNNYTKVALITLFVTTFTLFLGWVPIGVLIPQGLFFVVAFSMHPEAFGSKTLVLYYMFFAYQLLFGILGGSSYDVTILGARFLGMVIPLHMSTVLYSRKYQKDSRDISKFVLVTAFVTILLSIRVLINDGNALRVASMANSTGDWEVLYGYWKQGMASYDMAAMMLFMPVVLIYRLKTNAKGYEKLFLWTGIIITIIFMYLGQVTTTFILCLMVTILSFLNIKNRSVAILSIGLMLAIIVISFTGIMDWFVSITGEGSMNERFSSVAAVAHGGTLDEESDAGIRWGMIGKTISSFISSPLFGSSAAVTGGHNYFLDMLAKYGVIGCLPFLLMIKNQFSIIYSCLSAESKRYYLIILIGFITLGVIKNMSGIEYWNYIFIYYPAILIWFDSKKQIKGYNI